MMKSSGVLIRFQKIPNNQAVRRLDCVFPGMAAVLTSRISVWLKPDTTVVRNVRL
jgi:hypothetical protein